MYFTCQRHITVTDVKEFRNAHINTVVSEKYLIKQTFIVRLFIVVLLISILSCNKNLKIPNNGYFRLLLERSPQLAVSFEINKPSKFPAVYLHNWYQLRKCNQQSIYISGRPVFIALVSSRGWLYKNVTRWDGYVCQSPCLSKRGLCKLVG